MDPRKVALPSGRELQITVAPFAESKALYQAMLKEVKNLQLDPKQEIDANFFKDLFCVGFSSKEIEECLWKCLARCIVDKSKVTEELFEKVEHRDDYLTVCYEVAKDNVSPFAKSLYAKYSHILGLLTGPKDPA